MSFTISTTSLQARLAALGFPPGPIDGIMGNRTREALDEALEAHTTRRTTDLFHRSGLHRIHWHWNASHLGVTSDDREHYHFLYDAEGEEHPGPLPPESNAVCVPGKYVPHTWNANTGAIGMAVDAMAGAVERPFDWGDNPMTEAQLDGMLRRTAYWAKQYWIPISRYSILSHAEIQPTLGIRQKWKWDISVIPGMDRPGGSRRGR